MPESWRDRNFKQEFLDRQPPAERARRRRRDLVGFLLGALLGAGIVGESIYDGLRGQEVRTGPGGVHSLPWWAAAAIAAAWAGLCLYAAWRTLCEGARPTRAPEPKPTPETGLDAADAFSFVSPLDLAGMKAKLDVGSLGPWREGDGAYFDYLAAPAEPGRPSLRLHPEGGRFVIETRRGAMDAATRALVLDRLLPLVEASDVRPDPGFY